MITITIKTQKPQYYGSEFESVEEVDLMQALEKQTSNQVQHSSNVEVNTA